jgi:hypothetical protein
VHSWTTLISIFVTCLNVIACFCVRHFRSKVTQRRCRSLHTVILPGWAWHFTQIVQSYCFLGRHFIWYNACWLGTQTLYRCVLRRMLLTNTAWVDSQNTPCHRWGGGGRHMDPVKNISLGRSVKADSHIPCRSHDVSKTDSHIPCRSPATTLPFSDSVVSYVKVPYLVHEVLLLSPSRNYILLNCYHNRCVVNYTSTHVLAPK